MDFNFIFQLKYLEKDEFKDVRRLSRIKLDGNQLSVVIDNLFETQKSLEHLGMLSHFGLKIKGTHSYQKKKKMERGMWHRA